MNIFDPHITGSLSVSASANIQGDLIVGGTIFGTAQISGQVQEAVSASHASAYLLTSSFENYTSSVATTGSNTFIGDQVINGSLLPLDTLTHDLGSDSQRWRDIYLAGNTINLGGTKITKNDDGDVEFKDGTNTLKKIVASEIEIGTGASKKVLKISNGKLKLTDIVGSSDELAALSGSFTGSFVGDGSKLSNIPASSVTGLNLARISNTTATASISSAGIITNVSIIPETTDTIDLGSPSKQWRDLYLSSGSLYINGQQVLSTTGTELRVTTDSGESIKIIETGSDTITLQTENGDITLTSSGNGNIELDAPVQIAAGKKILSSDGNSISFANGLVITGSIELTGTVDGVNVANLKNDVDAILLGSSADKNSFAEIVQLINSVDTTNDQAFAAHYTASNNRFNSIEVTTSSFDGRLDALETKSGSVDTLNSTQNNRISSLETTSGSQNSRLSSIESFTSSINDTYATDEDVTRLRGDLNTYTSSNNTTNTTQNNRLSSLETKSGSVDSSISNINTKLSGIDVATGSLSGRIGTIEETITRLDDTYATDSDITTLRGELNTYTSSNNTTNTTQNSRLGSLETKTGSLNTEITNIGGRLGSLETTSGSHSNRLSSIEAFTSSIDDTYATDQDVTRLRGDLNTYTSSNNTTNTTQNNRLTSLETKTGSLDNNISTLDGRLDSIESFTSSINDTYATDEDVTRLRGDFNSHTNSVNNTLNIESLRINSLELFTASIDDTYATDSDITTLRGELNTYTSSNNTTNTTQNNRLGSLETSRTSFNSFTSSIGTTIKDKLNNERVISGSSQVVLNDADKTGFNTTDVPEGTNLYYTDARVKSKLNSEGVISGSLQITTLPSVDTDDLSEGTTNLYFTNNRVDSRINAKGVVSGSEQIDVTRTTNYSVVGDKLSSLETTSGSHNTRLNTLESFKTTVETGIEFTGSNVTIKGNLLVKGTETRVNSTTVDVSDNIISLNGTGASNAGIEVRDVTSPGILSGSLIWDGVTNYWKGGTKGNEERILLDSDLRVLDGRLDSLEIESGSNDSRLDSLESKTGSYTTTDYYVTGATFNTADGVVTLTRNDGNSVTVDIDGRYLTAVSGLASGNLNMNNFNITNVNSVSIGDPGPNEGIEWNGGNGFKIFESPNDLVTNTAGNLQFVVNGARSFTLNSDRTAEFTSQLTVGSIKKSGGLSTQFLKADGSVDANVYLTSHPSVSAATSSNNSGRTYIQDILLDSFGHITGITTASETVVNTDTNYYVTGATFNTSDGVITITRNDGSTVTVDIDGRFTDNGYADTMNQHVRTSDSPSFASTTLTGTLTAPTIQIGNASFSRSGDQNHVHFVGTALIPNTTTTSSNSLMGNSSYRWSTVYGGYGDFSDSVTAKSFAKIGGTSSQFLKADGSVDTNTYLTSHPSVSAATSSNNSGRTYIQDILLDSFGHITGITTASETVVNTDTNYYTTGTTWNGTTATLTFTRNDGGTYSIQMLETLSDITVTGGTYNSGTQTLRLTKSDGTSVNVSGFAVDTDVNWYTTGATFNATNGVITGTRNDGGTWSVDIDGKYLDATSAAIHGQIYNVGGDADTYTRFGIYRNYAVNGPIEGHNTILNVSQYDGNYGFQLGADTTSSADGLYYRSKDATYGTWKQVASRSWVSAQNYLTQHPTVSAASSSNNSGRTYIQDILLDTFGHITGITTATETVVNTDTNYYTTGSTFNTGNGIITFTRNDGGTYTVDIDGKYAESVHTHDDRYYTETESDARYPLSRGALGTSTTVGDTTGWGNNLAAGTYTRGYVGHGGQVIMSHDTGGSVGNVGIETTYYGSMYVHTNVDSNSWVTKQIWTSYNFTQTNINNWNTAYGWGDHASAGYLRSHPTISGVSSNNSGRTYIQDILTDANGHITGITTATETVVNTDTNNYTTGATFNTGNGVITGTRNDGDTWTVDLDGRYLQTESDTLATVIGRGATATHAVFTSDASSRVLYLRGSGNIIQFEDASAVKKWEVVGREGSFYIYKNDGTGSGMKYQIDTNGNHTITGDVGVTGTISASSGNSTQWTTAYGWGNHADGGYLRSHPSVLAATSSNNSGRTYIQDILLDSFGHITGITTATETVVNTDTNYYTTGSTFNSGTGIITFTRNDGGTYSVNIAATLVDVTVTGGTYNSATQTLRLTKSNGTTVDVSGFAVDTDVNWYTTGATFNATNGVITGTRNNGGTWTVDIDGRYLTSYTETDTLQSVTDRGSSTTNQIFINNASPTIYLQDTDNRSAMIHVNSNFFYILNGSANNSTGWAQQANSRWLFMGNLNNNDITFGGSGDFAGTVTATGGNSTNWNTAYGWGNHADAGYLRSHPTIPGISSNNSGRTYIQDILTDANGHVTGITTATETVINTDTNYYTTTATFSTSTGVITFTRNDGGTYTVDIDGKYAEAGHNHDTTYLKLSGGNMVGNINFLTTEQGITWTMNTDGAYIKFYNTGDGDTNSRLEYGTSDNGNEYHRWMIAGTEYMNLKSGGLTINGTVTATGGNSGNWNTAYGWGNHASAGYSTLSGSNSFSNSYNEFGNGTGSVSNDGSWNGRVNIAGTQHARLDVVSVSDGIITSMFSHIGQGAGKVGTYSNHPLHLISNGQSVVTINQSGSGVFNGGLTLNSTGAGATVLDIQGTSGQLFSITDDLTGDLFSVSDASGVPIFNVNANGTVSIDSLGSLVIGGSPVLTAHPSVSAAGSSNNSGRTYIQDILLDSFGHITGITTATETVVNTDTNTVTSVGIAGDLSTGNITLVGAGATTVTKSGGTITITSTDTNTDTNYYTTGATFGTTTGIITFTRNDGGTYTIDIDGKYAESSHTHTPTQVGLGNVSNTAQVTVTNNSSLNDDTRNRRGVTRLYRRDDDSDFSVQTSWTGTHWHIRGYNGDTFHAEARVGYADSAASATTAGYATTAGSADQIDGWGFVNTGNNTPVNADTINSNGISYYTSGVTNFSGNSSDGALYSQAYSSSWQHQIAGDYRSGQIAVRGKNNNTWQAWKKVALVNSTTFSNVTSVSFTHGLGTDNVIVQVYDGGGSLFFPSELRSAGGIVTAQFVSARSGRIVVTG